MIDTEYLDLVNKFDQVIGQAPRRWVHRYNWAHRASHLLIFNQEKKIFLQKRSHKKAIDPGRWDTSVGGHVNAGESYHDCIIRETREELGVQMPSPTFWFKLEAHPATFHEFMAVYYGHHEGPFSLHPEEISDGQWFTLAEIKDWLIARPDELAASLQLIIQTLIEEPDKNTKGLTPYH